MPGRRIKAPTYETGTRNSVIDYALDCAIRDREGMQESIASQVPNFWTLPREEALAKLSADDRDYFVEIDGYLRDFAKMQKKISDQT